MRPFNAFYYFARIADCYRIRRNVFYHHTSSTDDAAVADGHSRANCNATSQPAVFANGYRGASLYGLATFYIVNGMVGRQELTVRAEIFIYFFILHLFSKSAAKIQNKSQSIIILP